MDANNLAGVQHAGEYGNGSRAWSSATLAALADGSLVDFLEVPAGTDLYEAKLGNAALGASTTISLGWRYKDGSAGGSATAILAAASTVSAGSRESALITPIRFEKPAIIYATMGGAAGTGQLAVKIEYVHVGTA